MDFPECELDDEECIRLNHMWDFTYPNVPMFSDEPDRICFGAGTTVYDICLQLAAYMGFAEIYLLGVDNTMNTDFRTSNHFDKNYISEKEAEFMEKEKVLIFQNMIDVGFEGAKKHAEKHGYKIYNATRGVRLETFERVSFDEYFEEEGNE